MFYTNKVKTDIDNKFKAMTRLYQEAIEKNMELAEKNKSLSERLVKQDSRIDKLETLFQRVSGLEIEKSNQDILIRELINDINKLKVDMNNDKVCMGNKFIEFRQETLTEIAGKFFDTLDKIFRTSKEISLIATLINTNSTELGQLKSQLLKPYIEAKHREERIAQGQEIVNKGQKIIEDRNALHEDIIQRQRKGEDITRLKIKLDAYNEIINVVKGVAK